MNQELAYAFVRLVWNVPAVVLLLLIICADYIRLARPAERRAAVWMVGAVL